MNQLSERGLTTVDVASDGNCFYRATCYARHGSNNGHVALRQTVASHIEQSGGSLGGIINVSSDDGKTFAEHVNSLRTDGVSAGEDAIVAIADFYQPEVHVHVAYSDPHIYRPSRDIITDEPTQLAFFEPGHFRAVVLTIKPSESVYHLRVPLN